MDSLDVNDTRNVHLQISTGIFCLRRNHTNAHNHESIYAVIKLPRNGNSKAE